jgi:hypothetical protein
LAKNFRQDTRPGGLRKSVGVGTVNPMASSQRGSKERLPPAGLDGRFSGLAAPRPKEGRTGGEVGSHPSKGSQKKIRDRELPEGQVVSLRPPSGPGMGWPVGLTGPPDIGYIPGVIGEETQDRPGLIRELAPRERVAPGTIGLQHPTPGVPL